MWIERDIKSFLEKMSQPGQSLPIKILKGPRQSGKTSILTKLSKKYSPIYFDDLALRKLASDDPRFFLDQYKGPLLLEEATLVPALFLELKRRVDESRREGNPSAVDIWITGSNQTLLQREVEESLAGRASYFDFNTLSIHEIGSLDLSQFLMRGGWPELSINQTLSAVRYLNDFIHTFIEKDIVLAAGIERRDAFNRSLSLLSGRVGQLVNYSDIAKVVSVDVTTLQSWLAILVRNGLIYKLPCFSSNINQRLIKTPKYYFEDVALAVRLQGWSEYHPLMSSPSYGSLIENIAISEVRRFFVNQGEVPQLYYLRSKEKIEVDLLIELTNQRYIAAEIKTTAQDFTKEQVALLDSLKINIVDRWVLTPTSSVNLKQSKCISFEAIWQELLAKYKGQDKNN